MSGDRHQVTDPDGRAFVIDLRTLAHLARRRPRMAENVVAVLDAIERPDLREDDPAPGRERFYRRDSIVIDGSGSS